MKLAVIEINDLAITLHDANGYIEQSTFAYIDKEKVSFGEKALTNIKLSPESFYSHFWQRLGYEEIKCLNKNVKHFADLAYLQLVEITQKLHSNTNVIFLVPSHYKEQQLALLLGLAASCKLNVLALLNQDVIDIEAVNFSGEHKLSHIGVHSSTIANMNIDASISLKNSKTYHELGLLELTSFISHWCNQIFLKQLRFDALHSAVTEQALFEQIYKIIKLISENTLISDTHIVINEKQIKLDKQELTAKITEFFNPLFEDRSITDTFHAKSTLYNLISKTKYVSSCSELPKTNLFLKIKSYLSFINEQTDIRLITSLPLLKEYPSKVDEDIHQATHIVFEQFCVPIKNQSIFFNITFENSIPFSRAQTDKSFAKLTPIGKKLSLSVISNAQIKINGINYTAAQSLKNGDKISYLDKYNFNLVLIKEAF